MPTKSLIVRGLANRVVYIRNATWTNSPLASIGLLRANPYGLTDSKEIRYRINGDPSVIGYPPDAGTQLFTVPSFGANEQAAGAKFRGKLRKGDASLGVTAASWKQSRDMISSRSRVFTTSSGDYLKKLTSVYNRASRGRQKHAVKRYFADSYLEVVFGWIPLFQDIHAAALNITRAPPGAWITGRHIQNVSSEVRTPSGLDYTFIQSTGTMRTTVSARVAVSNPNLLLANRLGLINPSVVIWDLIPWSFAVGMVVNVSSVLKSFSDFVGLDVSQQSVTNTSLISSTYTRTFQSGKFSHSTTQVRKQQTRTVGSIPPVNWSVKVPELSVQTGLTFLSLAVQNLNKITKLIT